MIHFLNMSYMKFTLCFIIEYLICTILYLKIDKKHLKIDTLYTSYKGIAVVECLTRDQGVAGASRTGITLLCPGASHINPLLILVQHRKTHPDITVKLLTGMYRIKSNKKY